MARLAASHSAFEVMNTTFVCTFLRCCLSGLLQFIIQAKNIITRLLHLSVDFDGNVWPQDFNVEKSKPTQLKQRAAELGRKQSTCLWFLHLSVDFDGMSGIAALLNRFGRFCNLGKTSDLTRCHITVGGIPQSTSVHSSTKLWNQTLLFEH